MNQWEKPQVRILGLERTHDMGGCTCERDLFGIPVPAKNDNNIDKNLHYCHYERKLHQNNCPSLNQGHVMTGWCKDTDEHAKWTEAHVSSCCCAERSTHGS